MLLAAGVLLLSPAIAFCDRKEGFYIDELWSYGLANSAETPFLQEKSGYMEHWHEPSFYEAYLTVSADERFSYDIVYANQEQDVHPPLFYCILHTVCSLFPGRFSKWYGLSTNLFFFAAALWMLYRLSGKLCGDSGILRFLPPVIYSVSAGGLSCVLYIRMYMMLTFFAVVFAFLLYCLMEGERAKERGTLLQLALVTTAGLLTQYYFLIFAFFMSVCYMGFRACRREWKRALHYALAMAFGIGLGILIFPALLHHIFLGDKGRASMANAAGSLGYLQQRLAAYRKLMAAAFFGKSLMWKRGILLLAAVCVFYGIFRMAGKKRRRGDTKLLYIGFIVLSVSAYFVVVAKISTDVVDRYQFLIFPFAALLLALLFAAVSRIAEELCHIRQGSGALFLAAVYCLTCLSGYRSGNDMPEYLYSGYADALQLVEEQYSDVPGIYVTKGDHLVIHNCLFLAKQQKTYPLPAEKISELPDILASAPQYVQNDGRKTPLLLYVDIYYPEEETAEAVRRLLGYRMRKQLYDNVYTQIYLLEDGETGQSGKKR